MRTELQYLVELDGYDDSQVNYLGYSRKFSDAAWAKVAATVGADVVVGADNVLAADKLTETAVNADHYIDHPTITTLNTTQAVILSVWAKPAGRTVLRLALFSGATFANVARTHIDLSALTFANAVSGTAAIVSAYVQPYPDGWFRCVFVATPETVNSALLKVRIQLVNVGTTYLGDGTSGIYLDRAMLQLGSVLNDYVETPGAAGAGIKTFRFSSGTGFTTLRTDTPAGVHFDPRIKTAINFNRNLIGQARVAGGMRIDAGEIVLNNVDQGLAGMRNYGFDGRSLVVRVGSPGAAYPAGYPAFMTGTVEQVEVGAAKVTIRVRDRLQILSVPLQTTRYAGTNAGSPLLGAEGVGEDIKSVTKPLLYGRRYLIPATVVNTTKLTYQIHDGAVQAISAVYDQGVSITAGANYANLALLEAAVPGAGTFITCTALGLFRLGSTPAGKVLVDAQGDNTGGYISKPGEIINRLLITRCGFTAADIDAASFTAINAAVTGESGLFLGAGDTTTRLEALNKLVSTFGGWLAPNRLGAWQVGRVVTPPGSPVLTFRDADIIELDTQATNDETRGVPTWRAVMKHKPYPPMAPSDIAGGVTQARRSEMLQAWRTAEASDAAVKTKHLLATEFERETLFNVAADASAEATRQLNLFKVRRDFVHAVVRLDSATSTLDLGAEVRLITDRLGYSTGRNFLVLGVTLDGYSSRIGLDLWG